jgi:hypothetical protein
MLYYNDIAVVLEMKVNDLIETFVDGLTPEKLYYCTYEKLVKFGYCRAISGNIVRYDKNSFIINKNNRKYYEYKEVNEKFTYECR